MSTIVRLILLGIQLTLLSVATFMVTGQLVINEIWYFSGLLALIINSLLLEPWYPKTYDTLANSVIALILSYVGQVNTALIGWVFLRWFLVALILLSLFKIIYNSTSKDGNKRRLKGTLSLSKIGKASIIYSAVFWLSVLEYSLPPNYNFWVLGTCWVVLSLSKIINWELLINEIGDKPLPIKPIGIIGPSTLIVTSRSLNRVGTKVKVIYGKLSVKGNIIKRINRTDDTWGQIQLENDSLIGWLVTKPNLNIELDNEQDESIYLGNVNEGTTTFKLFFDTNEKVEIGDTIYLNSYGKIVLYQIVNAEVFKLTIKSGAQLDRKIKAFQIGIYDLENQKLNLNKSLPNLSEPIYRANEKTLQIETLTTISNKFTLGKIKNSALPINIDIEKIKESHLAVLGMTGMGKTTLCHVLIQELSKTRRITIMDQSGEFVSKLGYQEYQVGDDDNTTGVSVCEPTTNPAKSALKYLEFLMELAKKEYIKGSPNPRVLVIDEAHQFIPEPAGMGFGMPGRDESMKFGLNMMQVRKYGISIIFISQRTAVVSKSALSQCENLIAFKSVDQTGLDYLEGILGVGSKALLPNLTRGEAIIFGPAMDIEKSVVIETRSQ